MADRFHIGTFAWGLVLTVWGSLLFGVGVGWWSADFIEIRYAWPALIMVVGAVILLGALRPRHRTSTGERI